MSHTVTVTRTTTTTSTSAIILNTGYCKTVPGWLKIAEIIVGAIILFSLSGFVVINPATWEGLTWFALFKYIVVTFLIGSILLLLGCLVSLSTGSIIAKTSYEFIYHGGAFILYTLVTVWYLVEIQRYFNNYDNKFYIAGVLGIVNCILYCISAVFAYRSYRWP